jgi:hypothetical protein
LYQEINYDDVVVSLVLEKKRKTALSTKHNPDVMMYDVSTKSTTHNLFAFSLRIGHRPPRPPHSIMLVVVTVIME